jgi:uncharacterized protein (DUF1330 family)/alpha/beta superfamily hydrolase
LLLPFLISSIEKGKLSMKKLFISPILIAALILNSTFSQAQEEIKSSVNTEINKPVHGYMIANYTITNQHIFKQYMAAAGTLASKYNGKVIIYDVKSKTLEGNPESVMAVAEFPSVLQTMQFYNSSEYTEARKLRIASTRGSVLLAEGMPSSSKAIPNGYMIANYTIKDQSIFKKYMAAAGELAPKYNGKVIIYDTKARVLEGKPETIAAVAEFSSVSDAEKFYNSPEYTAAKKFRIAATHGAVSLAEGLIQTKKTSSLNKQEADHLINGMVELMAHSIRTPILRNPAEYGMAYEEVSFPAQDGVILEGWFIPGKSDRLIIMNHPMPANRYGYPGHLDPWKNFGGFEVNFLPEYKALHDAGYNILTYDMRNHGQSGMGNGGLVGHGLFEYRDVIGSLHYAQARSDTKHMKVALYSRCLGANSTIVAMAKFPEEFKNVKAMIALQPVTPKVFIERAMEMNGIKNGMELFTQAYFNKTGLHLDQVWPMEYAKSVKIPTLVAQVHDDFLTKPSNVQEIFDTIAAKDKKLFWIEGTERRFDGYNYFGEHPKLVLDWFDSHMQ